jgi:hypothetical protein
MDLPTIQFQTSIWDYYPLLPSFLFYLAFIFIPRIKSVNFIIIFLNDGLYLILIKKKVPTFLEVNWAKTDTTQQGHTYPYRRQVEEHKRTPTARTHPTETRSTKLAEPTPLSKRRNRACYGKSRPGKLDNRQK